MINWTMLAIVVLIQLGLLLLSVFINNVLIAQQSKAELARWDARFAKLARDIVSGIQDALVINNTFSQPQEDARFDKLASRIEQAVQNIGLDLCPGGSDDSVEVIVEVENSQTPGTADQEVYG